MCRKLLCLSMEVVGSKITLPKSCMPTMAYMKNNMAINMQTYGRAYQYEIKLFISWIINNLNNIIIHSKFTTVFNNILPWMIVRRYKEGSERLRFFSTILSVGLPEKVSENQPKPASLHQWYFQQRLQNQIRSKNLWSSSAKIMNDIKFG